MTDEDRQEWASLTDRPGDRSPAEPSAVLERVVERLDPGRALDVATGEGRNARSLAANGWTVDAIDVSRVALTRARERATAADLSVNWVLADADRFAFPPTTYDLVTISYFDARPSLSSILESLVPGGVLVYEHHLRQERIRDGALERPETGYRFVPNELRERCSELEHWWYHEDPPGGNRRVTLVGERPKGEIQGAGTCCHERRKMRNDHLITSKHLTREDIEGVLDRAAEIDADPSAVADKHAGKLLGLLFFEPSTRTKMSFETAMKRLGGDVIDMGSVESSSVTKGETLADTVRVIEGYADALVVRHPKQGAAKMASEFVDVPLLNAGDGAGHHPTQTLLDLYTIRQNAGLDDLSVGIMGDLKYGRTVHSLAYALTKFGAQQHFISPESLRLPREVVYDLHQEGASLREHESLEPVLETLDVLYVTRIQRERFPDENEYQQIAGEYQIGPETLADADDELTVMHPLPRVDEIDPVIDDTAHAAYFEQAHNGVPVRMALLDHFLGDDR